MLIRPGLLLSLSTLVIAPALNATWSIIIVDTRTKEVGVASATCVQGLDLRIWSPVVVVGSGAGVAQAAPDLFGTLRPLIRDGLVKGIAPTSILSALLKQDRNRGSRQYGIVDTRGRARSYTGNLTGRWAGGLTGKVGTLVYAIQGNVLTGQPVIKQAEEAIRNTKGDLAAKLMAAMEVAQKMGGDGRCSCSATQPARCGSPPKSFTKSADVAYLMVARQGDRDGISSLRYGWATGIYYLNLNIAGQSRNAPDPVFQLRTLYNPWRKQLVGRPDHHRSSVTLSTLSLPADGRTVADATVTLRDSTGKALGGSGTTLTITLDGSSTAAVQIGKVTAKGQGVYTFRVQAGTKAGTARLRVVVDDGKGPVLLSPRTSVDLSADPLWASPRSLSAATGGLVRFVLQGGVNHQKRAYVLLASASGSKPGIPISTNLTIPVNPDPVFFLFLQLTNSSILPSSLGVLDSAGHAQAGFVTPPGMLRPLRGRSLTFAWASLAPIDFASNPVTIAIGQ
jgi:uncharacterized Ntn-hydrolase superfamily protein